MKLYYTPGACSLSPHIVAEEAGVALDLKKVDLKAHKLEDGSDYYAVNPKGAVPALVLDDARLLTEGPAIVQYIADLKPESGLAPKAGSFERYKLQEWLTYINGEIHKTFTPLFRGAEGDARKQTIETLEKKFAFVEKALQGNAFLLGNSFSAADAYFFVMLFWATRLHIPVTPALKAWFDKVAARPKVRAAMAAEGLA
ncbi:MAG: glutathione transferase GstA [Alphaproteobacteria bacterium]|nr:glutathione transferase GstA [Alphaproteobacteria bacterium]MBV9692101.1 glutathione transferase GstA [Alphaproteobacteria bacterium]